MNPFSYLCFMFVCHTVLSVPYNLVVICWERGDPLALLYVMFSCVFVTFPYGVLGQVWFLIVSIHDLCLPPYFTFTINRLYNSLNVFSIRVENSVNPDQMTSPDTG